MARRTTRQLASPREAPTGIELVRGARVGCAGALLVHKDLATTLIYADFAPGAQDAQLVAAAFARGPVRGPNLSEPQITSAA